MFDVELKNAGHDSGSKMVTFIMDQGSKMDVALKAMKALIASCTEFFSATVELSKEEETSSSYSDLTPHDIVEIQGATVGGGNQHVEEVDQVEDITAITALPVSTTEVLVSNATPVSATVGEKTLDDCHVAEVTTPSLVTDFQVVVRDPPPLPILAPGFSPDNQLSAPLAPDVAETVDHVGVISEPNGHEVSMPPPRAPSLATDKTDLHEGGSMNKKEAKLKKRKDRE
jgi:phosphoribosylanthranilate isomerase